ncbi:helix-turn-helix transcriptional regulator [Polyangium sorediatum]|uniref:Sigma factor-like helix-turn-helix DNA-binding protein n=1 Tax=Polyangium sorediatum TaxID=889274 RepID=A0ABT6NP89_9BACT|nr:sigma factor-like helix-turn-helix DNA-binding protein [Polyangium sorediatum]MDI1430129.1 sigma factor-like helix-turn-helix DNA-binding protein [Polyangium sorediatum]
MDERQVLHRAAQMLSKVAAGNDPAVILDALAQCVPTVAGLISVVRPDAPQILISHAMRLPTELLEGWMRTRSEHLEPALRLVFEARPGGFWRDADTIAGPLRDGLEVLHALDDFGLGEGAGYKLHQRVVPGRGTEHVMLALLTERGKQFPRTAPAMMEALAADVRAAVHRASLPLVASRSILSQITEEQAMGYICINRRNGAVLEVNQRAFDLIAKYHAREISRSRSALLDFADSARSFTATRASWQIVHPTGFSVLEVHVHALAKETHELHEDVHLLAMREWILPSVLRPPRAASSPILEMLPPRKREIALLLVGSSLSYKEIAHRLGISPGTVRAHVQNIYRIAGVDSRPGLTTLLNAGSHDEEDR